MRCKVYRLGAVGGWGDGILFVPINIPGVDEWGKFIGEYEFEKEFLEKLDKNDDGTYKVSYFE